MPPRVRPRLHLTVHQGWSNDPHGLLYLDGTYHLFFQYVPGSVTWAPQCHWGHATSRDLVHWVEQPVALEPRGERGCWSGSAVIDEAGPVLVYTSIHDPDWSRGRVALARPSTAMRWRREPDAFVIPGPPDERAVIEFRDPQVRRDQAAGPWRAVLGAGLPGDGGCAVQYSSPDLREWTFDGVLASRSSSDGAGVLTGEVWECPQLLQVDGAWVLLVSVMWRDQPGVYVAWAVGDLEDGIRFHPHRWGRLTAGDALYATTTFLDADGRPCAMSWFREIGNEAPADSDWCGAMSLVHVLGVQDGAVTLGQHPSLEAALPAVRLIEDVRDGTPAHVTIDDLTWRLRVDVHHAPGGMAAVSVDGSHGRWALRIWSDRVVVSTEDGEELLVMPLPPEGASPVLGVAGAGGVDHSGADHSGADNAGAGRPDDGRELMLDMVVDADMLEVIVTGVPGIGAARVPVAGAGTVVLAASGPDRMERASLATSR